MSNNDPYKIREENVNIPDLTPAQAQKSQKAQKKFGAREATIVTASIVIVLSLIPLVGPFVSSAISASRAINDLPMTQEESDNFDRLLAARNAFITEQNIAAKDFIEDSLEPQGLTLENVPEKIDQYSDFAYQINHFKATDSDGSVVEVFSLTEIDAPTDALFSVYAKQDGDFILVGQSTEVIDPRFDPQHPQGRVFPEEMVK
jgi:hypothetical protein